ncbi:GntR family transcriptional regulator [Streptomyces syringium]|uniref:GntR family transcriptional regulator n=1 Tax=Streptomyces syringium TaxID=76729 RepID=UPI00345665E1
MSSEHGPRRGVPKYLQVADDVLDRIRAGGLRPGQRIPSESQLMARYGVSVGTVRKAMAEIRTSGLVETLHGRGSYVVARPPAHREPSDRFFRWRLGGDDADRPAEGEWSGAAATVDVLYVGPASAPPGVAERLGVPVDGQVLARRRLHCKGGTPVEEETAYLAWELAEEVPELFADDPGPGGVYARLEDLLQSKLSRCRNGSRRHRRLAAARKKVAGRTRQRLRDFNHQVTAEANRFIRDQVAAHVQASPVGTSVVVRLVVGDVRGVERNTRKGRRASRSTRQQLSQWERGTQERQLAYKTGLTVRHVSERYSSQICPYCLTRRKVRGRSYVCVNDNCCAPVLNRDAVGGVNIHTLAVNDGMYVPVSPETRIRVKYLRAQPGWSAGQRERHGFHQRVCHRAGEGRNREARSSARNRAPRTDQHVGAGVAVVPRQGNSTDNDGGADILRGVGRAIARTTTPPV